MPFSGSTIDCAKRSGHTLKYSYRKPLRKWRGRDRKIPDASAWRFHVIESRHSGKAAATRASRALIIIVLVSEIRHQTHFHPHTSLVSFIAIMIISCQDMIITLRFATK